MSEPRRVAQARGLVAAKRYSDALTILGALVAADPSDAEAWRLIAQCKLGLNDPAAALDAARSALRISPRSEWAHRLCSIALMRRHRYSEARDEADEAVRIAPGLWLTHMQRADVDIHAEWVGDDTLAAATRAVELAPTEPAAHITLGRVHLVRKNNRLAESGFREALRLDPSNAVARNNLAVVQLRRRRLLSAGRHLIGALRLEPNSPLFAANLRLVLRNWATILDLLGVVGCVILLNTTDGRYVSTPRTDNLPGLTVTVAPGQIFRVPATQLPPAYHYVAATGRPAVLVIVPAVLVLALLAICVAIRRSIGPRSGQILLASLRRDGALRTTVSTSLLGVIGLAAAAAAGLPLARGLVGTALVCNVVATVITRVTRRRRREEVNLR